MSETRKIPSKENKDIFIGEITLPDGKSEEEWARALSGYASPETGDKVENPIPLEDRVTKLEEKSIVYGNDIEKLKADVELLKPKETIIITSEIKK